MNEHHFAIGVRWTGNQGSGTSGYRAYSRDHEIFSTQKRGAIEGSSDPAFRGDASRYNPEEMLVAALSACHMLWYLHVCAEAGVVVTAYEDAATGTMALEPDGAGQFTEVVLAPAVQLADPSKADVANELHHAAHAKCFIARSVNFPVRCVPKPIRAELLS